jgi:hypothetical protein
VIWSEASPNGRGWPIGLAQAAAISIPGFLLLWAQAPRSGARSEPQASEGGSPPG